MARLAVSVLLPVLVLLGSVRADDASDSFFELKIRPVLVNECLPCHGGKKTNSGLTVDSREALLEGWRAWTGGRGRSSRAEPAHPGNPADGRRVEDAAQSTPFRRGQHSVQSVDRRRSELAEGRCKSASAFRIRRGGRHWAFERVERVEPPLDPSQWSERPVDRFIAAKQRAAKVTHVRPADKRTLIRRVTFDLIGLPPSPDEIADFLSDTAADAFSKVVERLLASPHYGERWGRHWMDVVRYADTAGDNADYPVPEAALYRDYIIDSFNKDKPFDRFVREQLAGDILSGQGPGASYADPIIATGFLALSRRYATAPFELWHLTLEDTIETTGRAFLGLTLRCARCHDHKFDPVTSARLLRTLRYFRKHDVSVRGFRRVPIETFPSDEFCPSCRA